MNGTFLITDFWMCSAPRWKLRLAIRWWRFVCWCAGKGIVIDYLQWYDDMNAQGVRYHWHYRWTGKN